MTVQELRDQLDALIAKGRAGTEVHTEGCDCIGPALSADDGRDIVVITRDHLSRRRG